MAYGFIRNKNSSFVLRIKMKFGLLLCQKFPLNKFRVLSLRYLCNYSIGNYVYLGPDLLIATILNDSKCKLKIEERVAIGPRVTLILSSDANWSNLNNIIKPIRGTITLKKDCWIGAGAVILPNISIGESSIVGAGSVVTRDVPDFTVVAGVPAKVIKTIK